MTYTAPIVDGSIAAQNFKYYAQQLKSNKLFCMPLNKVPFKTFYYKNQQIFDNLIRVFNKNKLNVIDYIKWCVLVQKVSEYDVKKNILKLENISMYIEELKIRKFRKRVFKSFIKTLNFIAYESVQNGYLHGVDYFKKLILDKKLAAYYVSGRISTYFFAAIPHFYKIVEKLDSISQDEFRIIVERYDVYHQTIIESMHQEVGRIVYPFLEIDKLIEIKKQKKV